MSTLSSPATTKPHKSMLRNLFVWKKSSSPIESESHVVVPNTVSVSSGGVSDATKQPVALTRKPSLSQRSRSDTAVPQQSRARSKSRRRDRSRCRAVWDPPPLFQAYNQAFMYDTLQTPTKGFLDWLPRNSPARSSIKTTESVEDVSEEIVSPSGSHRRSMSDSNSSSLSRKLIFLSENGHILQYKVEGSHDRLPERVLELSRESVAFASDAIIGQHWVLEICPYGRAEQESKVPNSKSAWSRMTLKTLDTKRLAEKLLLVFDNANTRFDWLFAIRKQIEGFGGLEYQPDAPPLPQPESGRPKLRQASSEYFKRMNGNAFSRSSPALPSELQQSSAHEKDLPQLPARPLDRRSVSARSTTASSVATRTSLEGLRESYSGSSITGTAIGSDVSATSLSPTMETFPPLLSPTLARDFRARAAVDKSMPRTPTSPLYSFEETSNSIAIVVPQEDQSLPATSTEEHNNCDKEMSPSEIEQKQTVTIRVLDTTDTTKSQNPTVLESAPIPELRRRLRQARRNLSVNDAELKSTVEPKVSVEVNQRHVAKPSLSTSKGSYGLFPRNVTADTKGELPAVSQADSFTVVDHSQESGDFKSSPARTTPPRSQVASSAPTRSNLSTKRPVPIALPHLLGPIELEQPMRSPAVTAAMLDSNFGTIPCGAVDEPDTPVEFQVPDFEQFKVAKNLFDSFEMTESKKNSPSTSPASRTVVPRRSMPNFHHNYPSSVTAPVGPPPSGPLPAVPAAVEGRSSRMSTPSKRVSAQGSTSRRASTKSAHSIKKGRSPAPSFSVPLPHPSNSFCSSIESYSQTDIQNISTFLSLLSAPKAEETSSTIGHVSVSAAPTEDASQAHHQKSQSISSARAGRPHKAHMKMPSKASVEDLASLGHHHSRSRGISSPLCAFESDFDYSNKGCFGLSSPH